MDGARASITEVAVLTKLAARRARVAILMGDYQRALQEARPHWRPRSRVACRVCSPTRI